VCKPKQKKTSRGNDRSPRRAVFAGPRWPFTIADNPKKGRINFAGPKRTRGGPKRGPFHDSMGRKKLGPVAAKILLFGPPGPEGFQIVLNVRLFPIQGK